MHAITLKSHVISHCGGQGRIIAERVQRSTMVTKFGKLSIRENLVMM